MEALHRGKGGVGAVGLDHGPSDLGQVLDNELDPAHVGLCGCVQDRGEDSVFISQSFICLFADLMNRPKALSFFRLSRYDISWYSDSFLSFM